MDDERKLKVLERARETLQRLKKAEETQVDEPDARSLDDDELTRAANALINPRSPLYRWAHAYFDADLAQERPQPEPEPDEEDQTAVETKTKQQNWDDWNRWADDKVQRAIEAEHKLMVAAIGDALGEIRAQMREHVEEEIGKLRATLCEFEKTSLERLRQDVQNLRLDLLGRNVGQTSFAR